MAVINFPTTIAVSDFNWSQQRRDIAFTSTFGSQAQENSPPLWAASLSLAINSDLNIGAAQALLLQLHGKTNQLALWNIGRPVPLGTMRGTMTLNAAAAQGATTMSIIAGTEAGKTLAAGDYLGLGSGITQQVVMVTGAATANGSGIISVTFEPALRNAYALGASVTWNMPAALFRQSASKLGWDYIAGSLVQGIALELIEDYRT